MHKIYVYGTLRPGTGPIVDVPGTMYDLGWFPGIKWNDGLGNTVKCEVIEADDQRLARLDHYEGYDEASPETSLYIREVFNDGYIYIYNRDVAGAKQVKEGDWLAFCGSSQGVNAHV